MMRIIFSNNYHYLRGGSERVYFEETRLLEHRGHTVIPFSVSDPEALESPYAKYFIDPIDFSDRQSLIRKYYVTSRILYSFNSRKKAMRLCNEVDADLAHFHNIYHRVNPAVLPVFRKKGIPTVLTLHDYKILCPVYTMYTGGQVCEKCPIEGYSACFKNRCNKGNSLLSFISTLEGTFHNLIGLYRKNLDFLISPSKFLRQKFIQYGWPEKKVKCVPNFLDLAKFEPEYDKGSYFLYLGRLSQEKGITTLIDAFSNLGHDAQLAVAGGGPLESYLKERANGNRKITFLGHISGDKLRKTVRSALAVVVPSEWYENAPMSVLEALAYGKPVIGSRIGGIPEMVNEDRGVLFEHGNINELGETLARFNDLPATQVIEMGRSARIFVEKNHSADIHYEKLMSVYHEAADSKT